MSEPRLAGLEYVPGYLDQDTQDELLSAVDEQPWQTFVDHRVQVYGYQYNHRAEAAYRIGELPAWSADLALRLMQDGFMPRVPNQLVVNEYPPGIGLFEHIDQAAFGEAIVSVSLGSTCVMRFTRDEKGESRELLLEPGSALVLTGEARWDWKHGIPARPSDDWHGRECVRSRRVSLTFRGVADEAGRLMAR
jgi:alkylated DNA repair dioxygenase AlkB